MRWFLVPVIFGLLSGLVHAWPRHGGAAVGCSGPNGSAWTDSQCWQDSGAWAD